MDEQSQLERQDSRPFIGLRWKVLIGISLTLLAVIVSLTLYARDVLIGQFERERAQARHHQAEHFLNLIADRYQQMNRLANIIPLLATNTANDSPLDHLQRVLKTDGGMLDLEWDIRSVHWISSDGRVVGLWPPQTDALPAPLLSHIRRTPEQITEQLICDDEDCRQYLSSPMLWHGETAGTLVLGRAMASVMLAFRELTGADLAIAATSATGFRALRLDDRSVTLRLFGATHAERMLPLLESVTPKALLGSNANQPLTLAHQGDWYEVFRISPSSNGLIGLVINRTTEDRRTISRLSRNSLFIGLSGLAAAELLLLLILRGPVNRISRLSNLLPLLAEGRFTTLTERLPRVRSRAGFRDEIDETIEVTGTLTERMAQIQAEREAAQNELRWLADHDSLTALLNRRRFDYELALAVERARKQGERGALLFIDLDNFKDVNDTSGHQTGDLLLRSVAKNLASAVNERGLVGRFGGDEFAVLIDCADQDELFALAENLQTQINSTTIQAGKHCHQVSASIGIVVFPDHGTDTQALMANADLAMYQAKASRRGRWHLYSNEDMARAQANARVLWSREITEALNEGRMRLHYQPIMALPDRRIWRAEGLLRMELADGRIVGPAEFIPVAERTGLINAIDRWVIAEAIRVLREQPELALAINLSAKALADASLDAELARLLASAEVEPQRLTLEITETVAIENIGSAVARMESVRALGCRFALDDFGSGFASYAYLKQLPVADVKIDGSFICHLDTNTEDRIFVKAAVEMAHAMGKRVIAEFVESQAILDVLCELGVDFAQGYFIGRPAPLPPRPALPPLPITQFEKRVV